LLLLLLLLLLSFIFYPGTQFPGNEKITLCNTKKYKNQAGMNLTPPPPPSHFIIIIIIIIIIITHVLILLTVTQTLQGHFT